METIPGRVRSWVDATPGATAIIDRGGALTYAELWRRSGAAALELVRRGVVPGDTVALTLAPGADAVVLALAVLRCSATVAPLDPRWPAERRRTIDARLSPRLGVGPDAGDVPPQDLLTQDARPVEDGPDADDLTGPDGDDTAATVFFTSGTSGEPKMIPSPHRALTRLVGPGRDLFPTPGAVMLHASRPGWDVYSFETWGPLCGGGTVHVLGGGLFPDAVAEAVAAGVTHAWITSSVLNFLVDEDVDCLQGLHTLWTGGESLSPPHVGRVLERHPGCTLVNGYGPVENCIFATTHRLTPADLDDVPIGTPVNGTVVALVADASTALARQQVVDDGAGEIWLSGSGLAAGYLGDVDGSDAFLTVDGTPWYRTGDHAVRADDGTLRFRGRVDRQVKIRGARVQPEELEVHASALLGTACRAVPVPGRWSGYDRLALFVTGPEVADTAGVRRDLGRRVPRHLVPDVVRHVAHLPVTANGKVDDAHLLTHLETREATTSCPS